MNYIKQYFDSFYLFGDVFRSFLVVLYRLVF